MVLHLYYSQERALEAWKEVKDLMKGCEHSRQRLSIKAAGEEFIFSGTSNPDKFRGCTFRTIVLHEMVNLESLAVIQQGLIK